MAYGKLIFHADSVTDNDEEVQAGEENSDSKNAGEQNDPIGHDKKDDWDLAIRYRDIQRYGYLEPKEKKELSEKAIRSVMERARESLGPIQKPHSYQLLSETEAQLKQTQGSVLELDVEESLLQNLGKNHPSLRGESVYQVRSERDHGILLLLDTSLSMKGEKLALLGITVAAVCESVPKAALCILGFDSEIHAIKEFKEDISTEVAVERTLSIPPGGFTNIDHGLKQARMRLDHSSYPQARVILISDGRYTEGKDPTVESKRFRFIYPVKIGKDPTGRTVMREIADTGQGRFAEVREMHDLPRFLLNAIRSWVK